MSGISNNLTEKNQGIDLKLGLQPADSDSKLQPQGNTLFCLGLN